MSRISTALDNNFTALCMLRDELALRTALLEADLKDRWNELEAKMDTLREHIGRAEVAADHALPQIEVAAQILLETIRNGYTELKHAMKI
ncbi:hypothetical protein [Nevskia soli]|uniref:hypothetical protein n=1 Tax=Nevskia soli TaxID=418856 RepID=UPI0004A73013|nr:hypothetical protein [Nevskia soli]